MSPDDLAIYGGTPAVKAPYRERWRQIRLSDVLPILAHARRDVSTLARGDGPIAEFEQRFAQLTRTTYALAMNSGTAALHSAYFAVGVKPGTEVIVPGYTFFATASPILQCGGRPVFCDVDPRTLLADADDVERRITPRTRAICVVHLWGNPAPLDRFVEIARRHGVALIEDCSHAHGACYRGVSVGSWGDIGCFSLQGPKAVSGGEAGIAVTNDPVLFDRMLVLGHYGRLKSGQARNTFDTDHISLGVRVPSAPVRDPARVRKPVPARGAEPAASAQLRHPVRGTGGMSGDPAGRDDASREARWFPRVHPAVRAGACRRME